MNELISIITASYNSAPYIYSVYEAINKQTYEHWEWLITDDCSTDDTMQIIKKLASLDSRIKVFKNIKNSGAAVARNMSISKANGIYIAFIDSDDLWEPQKLELQLNFMRKFDYAFSFTSFKIVDINGVFTSKIVDKYNEVKAFSYDDMLKKEATLGCSTVILNKSRFKDISMPLLRTGQDYALWLKLLKTGETAYLLPESLTSYRILPDSISRNKFKKVMRQWQIYRDIEKLTIQKSSICFLYYAYRAVFRR